MTISRVHIAAAVAAFTLAVGWSQQARRPRVRSHVHVIGFDGKADREIFSADRTVEAPNWSRDGRFLILNAEGKLWRLPVAEGELEQIPTGEVKGINNDHGISPDGKWLAISAGHIFILPFEGGTPRQITALTPSYWHGWAPDGKTVAYCA
jgi:Tol biopolymer transport system component